MQEKQNNNSLDDVEKIELKKAIEEKETAQLAILVFAVGVAILLIIAVGAFSLWSFFKKADDHVEITTSVESTEEVLSYTRVSNIPWSNNAFLYEVDPESVREIHFVSNLSGFNHEKTWIFDGLQCAFAKDTVMIEVKNGVKILGSLNAAFKDMTNLEKIVGLDKLETSSVKDMGHMFENCTNLKECDLSQLNTKSAIIAENMFAGCESLTTIDLHACDMSNVSIFNYMFYNCKAAETIYLPQVEEIVYAQHMFDGVGSGSYYDTDLIGNFNTTNCKDMSYMFANTRLKSYGIAENLNTSNLENASHMFDQANLMTINLSKWNTYKLKNISYMFKNIAGLNECNMANLDMSALRDCQGLFSECNNLKTVQLNWTNLAKLKSTEEMFYKCYELTTLDLSSFDGLEIGNARRMFKECLSLTKIISNGFNPMVSDEMFEGTINLPNYSENVKTTYSKENETRYLTKSNVVAPILKRDVNTTLPKNHYLETIDEVNISRHCATFEEDAASFCNIAEDWTLNGSELLGNLLPSSSLENVICVRRIQSSTISHPDTFKQEEMDSKY